MIEGLKDFLEALTKFFKSAGLLPAVIVSLTMFSLGIAATVVFYKYQHLPSLSDRLNSCESSKKVSDDNFALASRERVQCQFENEYVRSELKKQNSKTETCEKQLGSLPKPPEPKLPEADEIDRSLKFAEIGNEIAKLGELRVGRQRYILNRQYAFSVKIYDYGAIFKEKGCILEVKRPDKKYQSVPLEINQPTIIDIESVKVEFRFIWRYEDNAGTKCQFKISTAIN